MFFFHPHVSRPLLAENLIVTNRECENVLTSHQPENEKHVEDAEGGRRSKRRGK